MMIFIGMGGSSHFTLVLTHVIINSNNAQYEKSKRTERSQENCPSLTIIKTLDQQHETQDSNQNGNGEIGKSHGQFGLMQNKVFDMKMTKF